MWILSCVTQENAPGHTLRAPAASMHSHTAQTKHTDMHTAHTQLKRNYKKNIIIHVQNIGYAYWQKKCAHMRKL